MFQGDLSPVVLIDLLFDSGPVYIWTRPFTGTFDGRTYRPLGGITGALAVRQSLDRPSLDASAQLVGDSSELRAIAVQEEFQRRRATIRLGNIDTGGEIFETEVIFEGRMTDMPIIDELGEPSVTVAMSSLFSDIREGSDIRYSSTDQKRISPGDTFFDLVDSAGISTPRFGS